MNSSRSPTLFAALALAACSPPAFDWIDLEQNLQLPDSIERLDFEDLPLGPLASGTVLNGVRLEFPGSPGHVVHAAATHTPEGAFTRVVDASRYRLKATHGPRLLSPGGPVLGPGPDPAIEQDDLTLHFDPPVRGAWIAVLMQSLDGRSHVEVRATLADGRSETRTLEIPRYAGADLDLSGHVTAGLRAEDSPLARLEFTETDSDARFADCNIGYDGLLVLR